MVQLLSAFLLLLATFIHSGCSLMCSGGCFLAQTSFGGRLMFTGSNGLGNGGRPRWIAPNSKIIFQTPRGLDSASRSLRNSLFGRGRGQVWIGKRTKCPRSGSESDVCPSTESQPCLDTTLPCDSDVCKAELNLMTLSKLTGRARIVANWSIGDSCDVAHQSITIQQMTWDGDCSTVEMNRTPFQIENASRKKTFEDLPAYSTYKITLRVASLSGVYVSSTTMETAETSPGAPPSNVTWRKHKKGKIMTIRWTEPPCGEHHGEIIKYGYKMWSGDGQRFIYYTTNSYVRYLTSDMGRGQYNFQVCACTHNGTGPFTDVMQVNF